MAKESDYIKRHKSWQKYAKKELSLGRKPRPFKNWKPELKKKKTESVYFRGIKKESYESRLKRAGIDWEKDKPSARLKRSKK